MPKIVIGGGYPHQLPEQVCRAFERAGWKTEFFDLSPESPWHKPLVKPIRKLIHNLRIQRHPETFDDTPISNLGWRSRRWLKTIRDARPDAALLLRGNRIALPQLSEAASLAPHLCWMMEPAHRLDSYLKEVEAGLYALNFVYVHHYVTQLRAAGVEAIYYPHRAGLTPPETSVRRTERKYTWSFLGSWSPWREEVLRGVLAKYPNGFIMGARWRRLQSDPLFGLVLHGGYFQQEEAFKLYLDTTLGLDIFSTPELGESGMTMRVPELLACGCRVFTQPSPDLRNLPWQAGDRVQFFQRSDDLLAGMERALAQPASLHDQAWALAQQVSGHDELVNHVDRWYTQTTKSKNKHQ